MDYGIIGLIVLGLDIIAIVHILKSGLDSVMKLVWIVLVLVLPVIGMILWFVMGEKKIIT